MFRSEFFFWTTQELEYLFFLLRKARNFFHNLTLGYMTKTLNQIIFFLPPKSEYFFQQHWESEYLFRKKPLPTSPPPSLKLKDPKYLRPAEKVVWQREILIYKFLSNDVE